MARRLDAPTGPPDYDPPALVRGASRGFTVLLVGELGAPLVAITVPALASLWLSLVAAAGFALAGRGVGRAQRAVSQGAAAALGALTLTMPLRLLAGSQVGLRRSLVMAAFAVVVGGMSGRAAASRRSRAGVK